MMDRFFRTAATLLALSLMLVSLACNATPKTSDKDLEVIDLEKLSALLSNGKETAILIDVRSTAQYEAGHILGSINIPLPKIVAHDPQLAQAQHLIVYGDGWTNILSPAAAKKLLALGYTNVYDFRGGLELWRSEGRTVVTGPAAPH